MVTISYTRKPS